MLLPHERKVYYKVTTANLINRDFQLVLGLNQITNFDSNPQNSCSQGLYFCGPSQVFYWTILLGYSHVVDVEIPDDAKVIHFSDKSRADKLILSNDQSLTFMSRYYLLLLTDVL